MFFRSLRNQKKNKRGFTLIELAIVLAVTSLLTVGLWRMMASGNTQLRDQAAADQHKELIAATKAYLASSDGQNFITGLAGGAGKLPFTQDTYPNFLPNGFTAGTTNSYGQSYEVRVRADSNDSYSFMIKTSGVEVIPDSSGGRISSLIGGDGGFVYGANICGNNPNRACGAFGSWQADPANAAPSGYGYLSAVAGEVASRTFVGGGTADLNQPWLARIQDTFSGLPADHNGIREFNAIQTNISLRGNTLYGNDDELGVAPTHHASMVGAPLYKGSILNLKELELGGNKDSDGPLLEVIATCHSEQSPPPATCTKAVSILGDVGIMGRLDATAVYGARYIYDAGASDINLKRNIKPIQNALVKFDKINGYQFIMRDTGETKYGVIAQELEKVFPELVHQIDNGYKGVDYMGMIGPLVAAVKELQVQNKELRKEMDALKKKVLVK